jgi:Response regulators consisting of a CheY-like receiver domain and a winged-helix DNA-binding domain
MDIENLEERIETMRIAIEEMSMRLRTMKFELKQFTPTRSHSVPPRMDFRLKAESDELAELLNAPTYQIGGYTIDVNDRSLIYEGQAVKLTVKELFLTVVFAANINKSIEREEILNMIWGTSNYKNSRSMDVYVCKLRKLFEKDPNILILNIHGRGYKVIVTL